MFDIDRMPRTKKSLRRRRRTRKKTRAKRGGSKKCIYITLAAGLGNQLFKYAATLALSKKINSNVCLIQGALSPHTSRDYRGMFAGNAIDITPDLSKYIDTLTFAIPSPAPLFESFDSSKIHANAYIKDTRMPEAAYQDFTNLIDVLPEIKMTMIEKEFKKSHYDKYKESIDTKTSAFMHIRRGDYIGLGWIHPDEYFINSLKELNNYKHIKNIYVLSNDPEWCKQQMDTWKQNTSKKLEYKDIPDELECFYVMMLCEGGAIIPSSTFSAWGAMLGANMNPDSIIIYPKLNPIYIHEYPGGPPNDNVYKYPTRWKGI